MHLKNETNGAHITNIMCCGMTDKMENWRSSNALINV